MKLVNPFAYSFFHIQLFLFLLFYFHILYEIGESICLFIFSHSAISFSFILLSYSIWNWSIHLLIHFSSYPDLFFWNLLKNSYTFWDKFHRILRVMVRVTVVMVRPTVRVRRNIDKVIEFK
jgi:hypothetical protein